MADATDAAGLRVVDGAALPDRYREALRPGDLVEAGAGRMVQLPRFFFEIESWEAALETRLAAPECLESGRPGPALDLDAIGDAPEQEGARTRRRDRS